MKIESIMTKDVSFCRPDSSLNEAAQIMWDRDCGCVPVTDADGSGDLVGILTDRDVCIAGYTQGKSLIDIPVSSAMSSGVSTCKPDDTINDAEKEMRSEQVRRLPVVDEANHLLGIVSLADLTLEAERRRAAKKKGVTSTEIVKTLAAICEPIRK